MITDVWKYRGKSSELPGISREVVENLINKYFNQELRQKYAASIDSLKKLITGDPRMALPVLMVGYSQCLMPLKMDLFMLVDTVGTIAFGQKIVFLITKSIGCIVWATRFPPMSFLQTGCGRYNPAPTTTDILSG